MMVEKLMVFLPVVSSVFALGVNCIAHILSYRASRAKSFLPSLAIGFMAGLFVILAACIAVACSAGWSSESCSRMLFLALPMYVCLSYGYFHFVNMGEASIRIRIYDELSRHPEGVSLETLLDEYNEAEIMQLRLDRLVKQGDLRDVDGSYHIGRRRFELVAKVLFTFKVIVTGRTDVPEIQ